MDFYIQYRLDFIGATDGKLFKHTPSKPLAEVRKSANQILEQYRPRMGKLVADAGKSPLLPLWIPKTRSGDQADTAYREHIKSLAIPIVEGRPSLLLHDLGVQGSIMNEKQAKHIPDVFSLSTHTCADDYDFFGLADLNHAESSSTLLALVKLA